MHTLTMFAALLAAAPPQAHTNSPLSGATPNTVILNSGWQLTPQNENCVLTHTNDHARQDLIVFKPIAGDANLVVGIPLFNGATYPGPVQLTIVAQTNIAEPVGRLTFKPVQGATGVLLLARWPADQLLSHFQSADRLNFYSPDQHLLRSVRLLGGQEAAAALKQCVSDHKPKNDTLRQPPGSTLPPSSDYPSNAYSGDSGWEVKFDHDRCHLSRSTALGNRLTFTILKQSHQLVVELRVHDQRGAINGAVIPARLELNDFGEAVDGSINARPDGKGPHSFVINPNMIVDTQNSPDTTFSSIIDSGFLSRLDQIRWNQLNIEIQSDRRDTVDTLGANESGYELKRCLG